MRDGALTYLWDTYLLTCVQEVLHIPTTFGHAKLWLEGRNVKMVLSSNHTELPEGLEHEPKNT